LNLIYPQRESLVPFPTLRQSFDSPLSGGSQQNPTSPETMVYTGRYVSGISAHTGLKKTQAGEAGEPPAEASRDTSAVPIITVPVPPARRVGKHARSDSMDREVVEVAAPPRYSIY